jgi:hypothetical protein
VFHWWVQRSLPHITIDHKWCLVWACSWWHSEFVCATTTHRITAHDTMVSIFRLAGHFFSYQPDVVKFQFSSVISYLVLE